jgi:predicted N-acetyltransferase YhbS
MDVIIRKETRNEYNTIQNLVIKAFNGNSESKLIEKLRNKPDFIPELALVAEFNSIIVGYILFYPVKIIDNIQEFKTLALAPMCVLPGYQNKRIGSKLINEGCRIAFESGFESVVVLGNPKYYSKFGFKKASEFNIAPPSDDWISAFFIKELKVNSLNGIKGIVEYPQEYFEF